MSRFDLADAVVTAAPRVAPGGVLAVSITARNAGEATWNPDHIALTFLGNSAWNDASLTLSGAVAPGQSGTFTGMLPAPAMPGLHTLRWQALHRGSTFGPELALQTEVTCSDGVFCNGSERFVNGACMPGANPCDDGADCTEDTCDEALGTCNHVLGADCASCLTDCVPDCTDKECGDNGCGGSCGECPDGEGCAASLGQCSPDARAGTCGAPLPLTVMLGDQVIEGDSTDGLHTAVPTCNSTSRAVETVYTFEIPADMGPLIGPLGLEARSSGYDTVLHLRRENGDTDVSECLDNGPGATVACSDDSSPPGDYGSRIAVSLDPGVYYLIVDGFDASQAGPFTLNVRFAAEGCVPRCDGRYCGDDDGCGGTCGICDTGFACVDGRCQADPCVPQCDGRACGDDGCGGTCGDCAGTALCVPETGQCETFAACDHFLPTCTPACGADEFCGADCACHAMSAPMPDLIVSQERLASEILFDTIEVDAASCAVFEGCVSGLGTRRVLRFSVEAINQGQATLTVPPPAQRPDLFVFSPCHGHYHFNGFASYALLDTSGKPVLRGQKLAYCMEDTEQVLQGPGVACAKQYDCENQGIQAGWSDLYGNALDCQWLDITDLAPGDYQIQVSLNPERNFEEISFENNSATVPVTIPPAESTLNAE